MWLFRLKSKLDSSIKPYISMNSKRKLPVIICYKDNLKLIRNKILYNTGKIKYEYLNVNAVACELPPLSIDRISEMPEVSFICFDHKASLCLRKTQDILGMSHAKKFNLTGKGIGIGIIDSGVFPHPDLTTPRNSIVYFEDLINGFAKPYDDNGHGTFISGLISSSGHSSSGMYKGIAPDSNLCVIKAFDAAGNGFMSDIIKALDNFLSIKDKYNIKLLCLPFEMPYVNKLRINPLGDIIKKAINQNITVIVPSGNLGPQPYSIYFPGNLPEVITVGGVNCRDNNSADYRVSTFSGRGPTIDDVAKPDLVAPCNNITSLASNTSFTPVIRTKPKLNVEYISMSGTSISCALVTGICALIIEKTPNLTPQDIKSILSLATTSIGENKLSQGKGLFDFEKIIK